MVAMFGQAPGVYQYVVYIDNYEAMEKLPEHLMHKALKHGRGVDKPIGHNPIFIVASRGHKRGLPFIPFSDANEVVSAAEVQFGENGGTAELFQSCRDKRKGISELDGD